VLHDDSFDPDKAPACFANLQKDNIFAAGFIVGNPTGQRYIALAEQEKTPILGFFSGARQLYPPHSHYSFNVRASYVEEIKEDMAGLLKIGVKKFGVIYPTGPADAMWDVRAAMDKDSPTLVGSAEYTRNTLEVGPAIQSVRATHPEAVLLIGPYASVGEVIKRAHQQGWRPIFLTLSFVGAEEFISNLGDDAEGTVITQVVPPFYMTDIPTVAVYRKAIKKYYPNAQPGFISLEGFVTAMVLVEGLKRAGRDLTREKFIHSLESMRDFDLGLGSKFKVNYSPANHKASNAVYVTVVKAGTAASFPDLSQAKIGK
jgi:branched-chain amino acid transport system substrate-binding protein